MSVWVLESFCFVTNRNRNVKETQTIVFKQSLVAVDAPPPESIALPSYDRARNHACQYAIDHRKLPSDRSNRSWGNGTCLSRVRDGPSNFRKLFVLKRLRPDLLQRHFLEMFQDEARLAALLSHPNVVQTLAIDVDEGTPHILMEYLEGQSFAKLLRRVTRAQMPLVLQVYILAELLAGLEYAHELVDLEGVALSVVHRDISPGNVFLTYDGQVKLLDFGVAKSSGSTQSEVGVLKGKLVYMAPEQANGKDVDRRSDLFSVGVILWEAIAQRRLVSLDEADAVTLRNRINGLWQPISAISPGAPADLLLICEKAMSVDCNARYQTAAEFRSDLLSYLASTGVDLGRDEIAAFVGAVFSVERKALCTRIGERVTSRITFDAKAKPAPRSLTDHPQLTPQPAADSLEPLEPEAVVTNLRSKRFGRHRGVLIAGAVAVTLTLFTIGHPTNEGWTPLRDNELAAAGAPILASTKNVAGIAPTLVTGKQNAVNSGDNIPAAKEAFVEIVVLVAPREAVATLDGSPLAGSPYQIRVARDDSEHSLVVSAPGYQRSKQTIRLQRDTKITVRLEAQVATANEDAKQPTTRHKRSTPASRKKHARAAAVGSRKSRARASKKTEQKPAAPGRSLSAPRRSEGRQIDSENPYR